MAIEFSPREQAARINGLLGGLAVRIGFNVEILSGPGCSADVIARMSG